MDEAQKLAIAEKMRAPDSYGFPLMDDISIHDRILETEDTDATMDAVTAQVAARMSNMGRLYMMMRAAEETNQPNLAAIYWAEIQNVMKQMLAEGQKGIEPTPDPKPDAGNFDPRILPQSFITLAPPDPFGQSGALVSPDSPRTGAQNPLSRLLGAAGSRLGLPTREFGQGQ